MTSVTSFASLNLPQPVQAALNRMNYTTPTPIQAQAIPYALEGKDILGSANTGTGKTAAFSIPMIVRLIENPSAMALVLAPTRELASQTLDVVRQITGGSRDLGTALLIGGDSMGKQFEQLRRNPRIIIGTPGRINDHLERNPKLLANVCFIAVDEADRMLDMGFSVQIDAIFKRIPKERQMLMFSATFPQSIIDFSRRYLNNPQRVSVEAEKQDAPKIQHEVRRVADAEKYTGLMAELEARDGSVIIFVKTQHGTERLAKRLDADGHDSVVIHGGLRQNQRERAVRTFRTQRARIMVATDVAARGLDIPHIEHVINYDLPQVPEDYIHRIGRTGRAGASGQAMAFVTPSEVGKWNAINRVLNPGEEPMRGERSAGRKKPSFGGDRRAGYSGNRDRKPFDRTQDRPERKERSFGNRERDFGYRDGAQDRAPRNRDDGRYGDKPYANRNGDNRPARSDRQNRYEGGGKRFGNRTENGESRSRDGQGRYGDKPFAKQKRNDRGDVGNRWQDRDSRGSSERSRGGYQSREHRPDWREQGRGDGRMDNHISAKPKKSKPAPAKKAFTFKAHSRKPARAGGRPGE